MNTNERLKERWQLSKDHGIRWDIKEDSRLPHIDRLEMSGRRVSVVVTYGVNQEGTLELSQKVVWPTLRRIPNDTHASLIKEYRKELTPTIKINNELLSEEKPYEISFDGILTVKSTTHQCIEVTRTLFPSTHHSAGIQRMLLTNRSKETKKISIHHTNQVEIERGVYGNYILEVAGIGNSQVECRPGESIELGVTFTGRKLLEGIEKIDIKEEEEKRRAYLKEIINTLRLETPDPILNQAFKFGKIRAAESIFETQKGLMHSPGGLSFYAAVWTNDQIEYAAPFFAFLGNKTAIEASLNCYRLYRPFMGPDYSPIPTSIIAEGLDIWEGAGDRGDAAMYAYGAARFILTMGDKNIAEELWPAIEWCLEYCKKKMTAEGVIASDSDELEGRFPSGSANLCTSSLTYGGLRSAAYLARELGKDDKANEYNQMADNLYKAIENYFGANVEGYETYRYYDGNEVLRSWICVPLTMGIMERKKETIEALFSPKLWTLDGLATQSGEITFWDRSTLYGFRGAFAAGETERTLDFLTHYSKRRTLGDHVPYAVEAYPEGNQQHLSAESALYCRIFIEGILGINPIGFNSFLCRPQLPKAWPFISLEQINAFGKQFDLRVVREDTAYKVIINCDGITKDYQCKEGESLKIFL